MAASKKPALDSFGLTEASILYTLGNFPKDPYAMLASLFEEGCSMSVISDANVHPEIVHISKFKVAFLIA